MKEGTKPGVYACCTYVKARAVSTPPLNGGSGHQHIPPAGLLLTPWMAAQVSFASFLADVRALSRGTRPLIMDSLLTAAKGPILQEH